MRGQARQLRPEELQKLYHQLKSKIRQRLREFTQVPPSEYFYELAYCLLTPQTSAANAAKAIELLRKHEFATRVIDPVSLLHQKDFYIRFHHTKGKHLTAVKQQFPLIAQQLADAESGVVLREWLVQNVKGLGYKEASHFLRNIGHCNLAILDRHILRNLVRVGVVRTLPKSLTRKRYLAIEEKFLRFANRVNIPMDELDLLFWSMETGELRK